MMGAGALGYSLWAAYEGIAATRWLRVQGRITTAKVEEVIGGHGPNWEPKVTYSYQVAGTTHTGSRIAFSDNSTASQSSAEKKLGRYPVGTPVTVRYDRSTPALGPRAWHSFSQCALRWSKRTPTPSRIE